MNAATMNAATMNAAALKIKMHCVALPAPALSVFRLIYSHMAVPGYCFGSMAVG